MENIDWFNFENKDLDFPIYKKNPHIPKWGWIVLFIAVPIGLLLSSFPNMVVVILSCILLIVPILYFLKWDYKAIFQKPSLKEVGMAVGLFIGYMIYCLIISTLLEQIGIVGGNVIDSSTISLMSIPPLIFILMSEEFVKFIPFMFFMRVFFKYSNNRKLSVISSMLLVMVFFASLHITNLNMLPYALCMQGFGSIFEFIGYIKTKNILISYITHLCTDLFAFLLIIFTF